MRGVLSAPKRSSLSSKATVRDSSTSLGMTNNPFATAGDGGYSRSREASTSLGMTSIGRVMHACGHDAHISMIIGVARSLAKMKDQWHGTIVFVGQPAEEVGTGARAMLRDGLYTRWPKPNYALGFHDKADMEIGHIGVTEGYTSANVDSVDVTVNGIGGHGGYAYRTKDPVVLAAEMINQWQTIASRENNPIDPI